MKKVYIVHGWGGSPSEPMHKWLYEELTSEGYDVFVPEMPDPEKPDIDAWVKKLRKTVVNPDGETFFIGHSVGCQTILRYLETLNPIIKIGGLVFIAPWIALQSLESEDDWDIAKPWLKTKIRFSEAMKHVSGVTAIFSDNDPFVPPNNIEIFKNKLNAKIIIEENKGHFTEEDGVFDLPSALKAIIKSD